MWKHRFCLPVECRNCWQRRLDGLLCQGTLVLNAGFAALHQIVGFSLAENLPATEPLSGNSMEFLAPRQFYFISYFGMVARMECFSGFRILVKHFGVGFEKINKIKIYLYARKVKNKI